MKRALIWCSECMWNWTVLSGVWGVSGWGSTRRGGEAKALDEILGREWQADTAEFMPDPWASGRTEWCVSGEERRKTQQSWDRVHCWKPRNLLPVPLSYNGEEIKDNNKLTISCIFHSQLVAAKIFFASRFYWKWLCTNHMLMMLSNNASCFIPRWGSVLSMEL